MQGGALSGLDRQNTFSGVSPPAYFPQEVGGGGVGGLFSMSFVSPEKREKKHL